ncbi:hypothetical protein INQ41_01890 [Lysobacter ciconiae]|uniref:Secreted protein n=1 Tax=Novilysobacter ciconiae TaxID=2781022 RepID=A0A7S6UGJ3_9GAMM|nr:hypothetical protein [Lysobacter ciconiae]QOW19845.1 hypothetical protein INQ41_01890 [Lysobacter ciconiae]
MHAQRHTGGFALAVLGGALAMITLPACAAAGAGDFTSAPGYVAVDVDTTAWDDYYTAERFPGQGGSVFMPDADLIAPVRAMLLMEYSEGTLPHARYRVTYDMLSDATDPDATVSEVEVTRINLGPAFREQALEGVPVEHQAPLEAFGVGPHVSWRFQMAPIQGMTAHVVAAGRRELSDAQVAALDCLGAPCAQLDSAEGPAGNWEEREAPAAGADYRALTVEGPDPAYVVDQLLSVMLGEDGPQPTGPAGSDQPPRITLVVSVNAGGQDVMTTGLGRNSVVYDDAIGTVWVRSAQHADTPAEISELQVPRQR